LNTATHFHAGARALDLTTLATSLPRRKGPPNLRLESAAWRELSRVLAADPSAALSCALDIARGLCHSGSAGLSLIKANDEQQTMVRWEQVRGELAPYQGLDTPVTSSPCGLCLDAGATILVSQPARAFAWLEDTRPSILEELIAPLQDSSGRLEGTLWIAHHEGRSRCSIDDVRIMEQLAHHIVLALRLQQHATDREHALNVLQSLQAAQQALLCHDLSHERTQRLQAEASEREARYNLTYTLHTAAALLSMQARGASSPEVSQALLESRDRLQLLADVMLPTH